MASRTQIVCLCEGEQGKSIDPVFINRLMKSLRPKWLRSDGNNVIRLVPCGNRREVVEKLPVELKVCLSMGSDTTLMVWADCDDDCADPEALKRHFWRKAEEQDITEEQFKRVVFILAKDRIENWIEFLARGDTNESEEGPRLRHSSEVAEAARKLASMCMENKAEGQMPPSLQWSCKNWRALVERMSKS